MNFEPTGETYNGKIIYKKPVDRSDRNYRPVIERICKHCGNTMYPLLSSVKKGEGEFCGRSCSSKFTRQNIDHSGENNPRYIGKQDYVREYKEESECEKEGCNESRPKALCFHHRGYEDKTDPVSRMAVLGKYSIDEVKEEIDKCQIICQNCHMCEHKDNISSSKKYTCYKQRIVYRLKEEASCNKEECGEERAGALVFHHTTDNKAGTISNMITKPYTLQEVIEEIEKCEIICRNCHVEEH